MFEIRQVTVWFGLVGVCCPGGCLWGVHGGTFATCQDHLIKIHSVHLSLSLPRIRKWLITDRNGGTFGPRCVLKSVEL